MNFAYIPGEEEAALAYFQSRLNATFDLQEKEKLAEIVRKLQRKLRREGKAVPRDAGMALSLSGGSTAGL